MSEDLQRWEDWFNVVGMARQWNVVKTQFPDDPNRQLMWAHILESNRINAAIDAKKEGVAQ